MPTPQFAGHKFRIVEHVDEVRCPDGITKNETHRGWIVEFSDELDDAGRLKGSVGDARGSTSFTWWPETKRKTDGSGQTYIVLHIVNFASLGSCPGGWTIEYYRSFADRPTVFFLKIRCTTMDANDCEHVIEIKMEQLQ